MLIFKIIFFTFFQNNFHLWSIVWFVNFSSFTAHFNIILLIKKSCKPTVFTTFYVQIADFLNTYFCCGDNEEYFSSYAILIHCFRQREYLLFVIMWTRAIRVLLWLVHWKPWCIRTGQVGYLYTYHQLKELERFDWLMSSTFFLYF